jgi:ABC-2 type transport system ATP-binding protein
LVFSGLTVNIKSGCFPKDIDSNKIGEMDYEVNVKSEEEIPHIIRRIVEENGSVYSVTARRLSLEEIYFALFEKRREKGASK